MGTDLSDQINNIISISQSHKNLQIRSTISITYFEYKDNINLVSLNPSDPRSQISAYHETNIKRNKLNVQYY